MELLSQIRNALLPELILVIFALINLVFSLFFARKLFKFAKVITLTGIVTALISIVFTQISPNFYAFNNTYLSNIFTVFFKALILISGFLIVTISSSVLKKYKEKSFEFYSLCLFALAGACNLVSSNDFLTLFVSLEFLALSCYLLVAIGKDYKAKEAALKYAMLGAVASAILLFGISYLYGFTSCLNFESIYDFLVTWQGDLGDLYFFFTKNPQTLLITFSTVLIIIGLTFKMGTVPFANWMPDTYQGTGYTVGAFLSLIPKIAAFGIISRLLVFFVVFAPTVKIVLALIALCSVFVGNLGAMRQVNLKRFMGYSSIAHSGYIIFGLSVLSVYSLSTVLFYLVSYIFMNIGAWASISLVYKNSDKTDIKSLKGILYSHPYFSIAFSICLFSLAGLPVTSGFLAKIYLFSSVARSGFLFLPFLILVLLATVIGLYIYLRIIKIMFSEPQNKLFIDKKWTSLKFIIYFCSVVTLLLCVLSDKIIALCQLVAYYI